MRYLDRLINFMFSLSILILSSIVVMISTGFVEYSEVDSFIRNNIFNAENNTITCVIAIVVFLASLKTTVFLSKMKKTKKAVIMVDTNHGKVQIAQETIENTARNATKEYEEVKDTQVRIVKERKGVNVYMVLLVLPNTNIIELSSKVQDSVKKMIEDTTSVTVYNVDIKIKNIAETKKMKNKDRVEVKAEIIQASDDKREELVNENAIDASVIDKTEDNDISNSKDNDVVTEKQENNEN